jgi:hypothetical protein
MLVF